MMMWWGVGAAILIAGFICMAFLNWFIDKGYGWIVALALLAVLFVACSGTVGQLAQQIHMAV